MLQKLFIQSKQKKLKPIGTFFNFANPFIPPSDDQVSDTDDLF